MQLSKEKVSDRVFALSFVALCTHIHSYIIVADAQTQPCASIKFETSQSAVSLSGRYSSLLTGPLLVFREMFIVLYVLFSE